MDIRDILPISKSWFSCWRKCPWKAWFMRVNEIEEPSGESANTGNIVHDCRVEVIEGRMTLEEVEKEHGGYAAHLTKVAVDLTGPMFFVGCREFEAHVHYGNGPYSEWLGHAFLDMLMISADKTKAKIDDLKTGVEADFPFERNLSALCVKTMFPELEYLTFSYLFARINSTWSFHYMFLPEGECEVTDCEGEYKRINLPQWFSSELLELSHTEPIPTPGPHCEDWYGHPCMFLGNGCPLAEQSLVPINEMIPSGMALLKPFLDEKPVATKEQAGLALSGIQHMTGFLKQVEKGIKEWSRENGHVMVGDSPYGWSDKEAWEVDRTAALQIMISRGLSLNDIAKGVNISNSSIEKLGKRQWGHVIEELEKEAIFLKKTTPKFGPIKGNGAEGFIDG